MKNVLFIFKYPICIQENLKRKFDGQMDACIQLGYQVWYIEWDGKMFQLICRNNKERKKLCDSFPIKKEVYYHSWYFIECFKAAEIALREQKFDFIYMRYMPFFSSAVNFVSKVEEKNIKFIMEIPTYPPEREYKKEKRWLRKFVFIVCDYYKRKVFQKVNLFSLCGEDANGVAYGKPAINVVNGINVRAVPKKQFNGKEEEINILLLASMCYWQGYDRVIEGMKAYQGKDIVKIHFVGNDGDGSLKIWKKLVDEYGLSENIEFHGPLYGNELDEMFNLSDIGIASMGLYRRENLVKGATLKVREYMARGLPFVYTGEDISINENLPYVLEVENNDTPLNLEEIVEFVKKLRTMENVSERMRNYAEENMSWVIEFKKIFQAINLNGE